MRVPFKFWPETRQELLLYLLDALATVSELDVNESIPVGAVSAAMVDLHSAAYHLRHEAIAERIARIP